MTITPHRELDLIQEVEYEKWGSTLPTQFTHLKNAPIEEYFSRILDIATQMKQHGIKI